MMQSSQHVQAVPLAQCRHGHDYPLLPINPRLPGDDPEMAEFRAGIRQSRQLQPGRAILSKTGETAYVYIGGRRLTALTLNLADDPSAPMTIDLYIDDITPEEALCCSIAEQDKQQSLHPADHAKSFAYLVSKGIAVTEIAKRFGVKKRRVDQLLALGGSLSEKVWAGWRADEFNLECAQAFTLAQSQGAMNEVYERLKKAHQLEAYVVRRALQGDQGDAARFVNFVGLEAYNAAGGTVIVDLFQDQHTISDKSLAMDLARQKLDSECERLVAEGWSWAQPMETLPLSWRAWDKSHPKVINFTDEEVARLEAIESEAATLHAIDELTDEQDERLDDLRLEQQRIQDVGELRSFTDRQKKKSGCILNIDADGRLELLPGIIRPAEPRAEEGRVIPAETGDTDPPKPEEQPKPEVKEAAISAALAQDLAQRLNTAAASVVASNPDIAMAIALAQFQVNSLNGAVRLQHSGLSSGDLKLTDSYDFTQNVKAFLAMKPEQRAALFAHVVAASLKFEATSALSHAMTKDEVRAIVSVLPSEALRDCLVKHFEPDVYFAKAPKGFAVAAIEDVQGRDKANELADESKSELVTIASRWAAESGWLPIEMRPPNAFWDGRQPGAEPGNKKSAAPKKAAKKPAKKPTKKVAKKAKR